MCTTLMFETGQNRKIAALKTSYCVCFFVCKGVSMNDYMKIAIIQAEKSLKYDDVPVGCVIVKNNKIISKAYNKKEKTNNRKHRNRT